MDPAFRDPLLLNRPGPTPEERADDFLRVASDFHLGMIPTEQPHPATRDLSRWARHDLPAAIAALKDVDLRALEALHGHAPRIDRLARRVQDTLRRGARVFLCGCGATGRLSLSLESLWRGEMAPPGARDQVVSFMAGGDVALVHALEGFEDHPSYGARHLEQLGFGEGDLLVACTEGGETPYVIGATERAALLSSNRPCFLYCNPDEILARHVERFRRVLENPRIDCYGLEVGPMALAGSTRMQASTVLQLAMGLALMHPDLPAGRSIGAFLARMSATDLSFLVPFIEREADVQAAGDHVTYRASEYGITVLTDTTERAPTFSLVPFRRMDDPPGKESVCYVSLDSAADAAEAWEQLLGRPPRALDWPDVDPRTTPAYMRGFDFSARAVDRRQRRIPGRAHHEFRIGPSSQGISLSLGPLQHDLRVAGMPALLRHLMLKQVLNIHSTLVMGRLGRYEGNLMTWVTPTNGKLVDRAARHVAHLLARSGSSASYEEIVRRIFQEMEAAGPGEPIVLRVFHALSRRRAAS